MKKLKHKILIGLLAVSSLIRIEAQSLKCGSTQQLSSLPAQSLPANCTYGSAAYIGKYALQSFYVPTAIAANTPLIKLKYALHIFDNTTQSTTMYKNNATDLGRLATINNWVKHYSRYSDPRQGNNAIAPAYINDSRVEYECVGIYFYYDNAMSTNCDFQTFHNYVNTNYVLSNFDPTRLDALPIFFTNGIVSSCSGGGPTVAGYMGGYHTLAGNTPIGVVTALNQGQGDYFASEHIRHEIGHCMGWGHMYDSETLNCSDSDFLSDVFPSNNPYCGSSTTSSCGACYETGCNNIFTPSSNFSNNVMSGCANTWMSPLQMGRRRRTLSLLNTRQYVKDMVSDHTNILNITANETWDFDIQMYQDIVVKAGKTLTVKCKIAMAKEGKIRVEKNAKLVIDGGEITGWCKSGLWGGIEIEGSHNQDQNTSGGLGVYQGWVNIINNGTISNANIAINTCTTDINGNVDWTTTGGIITANVGNFINNRKDVQYLYYHNPNGNGNVGSFRLCNFKLNNALLGGALPDNRVSMYEVEFIKFYGCSFEYNAGNTYPMGSRRAGINSYDASYRIDQVCSGVGCSTPTKTQFLNFDDGVYADNSNPLNVISVKNSKFDKINFKSTYINSINTPVFTDNTLTNVSNNWFSIGLYLNTCKYYNVKNNSISGVGNGNGIGMGIVNSQNGAHEVYRNTIFRLNLGILAMNDNSGTTNYNDGLKMNCNNFTAIPNQYDILLTGSAPSAMFYQGAISNFNSGNLVRNQYAAACSNQNKWYVDNSSTKPIVHSSNSQAFTQPLPQPSCSNPLVSVINSGISYQSTHCPVDQLPAASGGCICAGCCRLATINTALNSAIVLNNSVTVSYNSLIDGGNTQTLLNAVNSSMSSVDLKNLLQSKSPYLSDAVLSAYFSKNGTPTEYIVTIHNANKPVTKAVWQVILSKNLPSAVQNNLNQQQEATTTPSVRQQLEYKLSNSLFNLERVGAEKLNYFLTDTLPTAKDSVIKFLQTNVSKLPDANVQLVYALIRKGDYATALDKANKLTGADAAIGALQKKLITLHKAKDKAFSLKTTNSADKAFFESYANNLNTISGKTQAQAILSLVYGNKYAAPIILPTAKSGSRSIQETENTPDEASSTENKDFNVYPNPTNDVLNIKFEQLTENTENIDVVNLELKDVMGSVVYKGTIKNRQLLQLPLSNLSNGVYVLTATNGKTKIYQTKVVKLN